MANASFGWNQSFWPKIVEVKPMTYENLSGLFLSINNFLSKNTMNTMINETEPLAIKVWAEQRMIYLELTDGRIFGFPADRFRILSQATDDQLKKVQLEEEAMHLDGKMLYEDINSSRRSGGQIPIAHCQKGRRRWLENKQFLRSSCSVLLDCEIRPLFMLYLLFNLFPRCCCKNSLNQDLVLTHVHQI